MSSVFPRPVSDKEMYSYLEADLIGFTPFSQSGVLLNSPYDNDLTWSKGEMTYRQTMAQSVVTLG